MNKNKKDINIILITIDALRPDYLNCYGFTHNSSPNIDYLANEGILFKNAYSLMYGTDPAHTTIFTGLLPESHGIYFHKARDSSGNDINKFMKISHQFLSNKLKDEGFRTIGIDWLGRWHKTGFDIYTGISNKRRKILYKNLYRKIFPHLPYGIIKRFPGSICTFESAKKVVKKAKYQINKNKHNSFFLFLHFWDAHTPYDPPKKYIKKFSSFHTQSNEKIKTMMERIESPAWLDFMKLCTHGAKYTDEIIQRYIGSINYLDNQIGKLIAYLKKNKLYDNSLIIISSDHGESLGEHSAFYDHHVHFQEILRAVLIMKFPFNLYANKIFKDPVHFVDIAPTIYDFLNINHNHKFDGISLISFLESKKSMETRELYFGLMSQVSGIGDRIGAIRKNWKYSISLEPIRKCLKCGIIHHQKEELFNLDEDPYEKHNVIDKYPDIAADFKKKVLKQKKKKETEIIIDSIKNLKNLGKL